MERLARVPAGKAGEFFFVVVYFYLHQLSFAGTRQGDMRPQTTATGSGWEMNLEFGIGMQ